MSTVGQHTSRLGAMMYLQLTTRVSQSIVGVVNFSDFSYMTLQMQKNLLNVVSIDGQCTCMHFKRA